MRIRAIALAVLILAWPGWTQDVPEEKKLTFNFKDASADGVLQYVSAVTGWIFVQEKTVSGKVDAVSDAEIPVSKCLEFLDSAFRRHGVVTFNPHAPSLPRPGQVVKIVDIEEAKRRNIEIHTGADPEKIPISDRVRTQILPLKAVNVTEVQKELGDILRKAIEPDGQMAVSTYSNSIILTGRADGINRAARILRVIDVSTSGELKIRVFTLKNADAGETAKTLNEVFKRETMRAESGTSNPISGFFGMFRGDRGHGSSSSPQPRALASEMVRITADTRTNAVIVSATEENMKIIEDLIVRLDDKSAAVIKLKLYALRYADATSAAQVISEVFAEEARRTTTSSRTSDRGSRNPWMRWMGAQQAQTEEIGAAKEVRAVADIRTNSVLVAASEENLKLIDNLMLELDRQVNDFLEVKIYKLENADPVQMATVLQSLFRPQVTATQQAGRTTGAAQGQQRGGGAASSSG